MAKSTRYTQEQKDAALAKMKELGAPKLLLSRGASTETGTNSCEDILMSFLGGVGQSAKLTIISQT